MFLVKLKVNQMTYESMHSAQAQSVRVTKKYILVLLITIVAALQEVTINVYFIFDSWSSPCVFSYKSISS